MLPGGASNRTSCGFAKMGMFPDLTGGGIMRLLFSPALRKH